MPLPAASAGGQYHAVFLTLAPLPQSAFQANKIAFKERLHAYAREIYTHRLVASAYSFEVGSDGYRHAHIALKFSSPQRWRKYNDTVKRWLGTLPRDSTEHRGLTCRTFFCPCAESAASTPYDVFTKYLTHPSKEKLTDTDELEVFEPNYSAYCYMCMWATCCTCSPIFGTGSLFKCDRSHFTLKDLRKWRKDHPDNPFLCDLSCPQAETQV